jgi:hypothetical protein
MVSLLLANPDTSPAPQLASQSSRTEFIYYQETFETGTHGWTSIDGTVPPNNWHLYDDGIPQNHVWWMGDAALAGANGIGGYHCSQYLVLDTPVLPVTISNPNLTFKLRYHLESPAGATAPYTGWDACNVRISTDNGISWNVITGTPAYNITSAYSFGYEHNEGENVAGWCIFATLYRCSRHDHPQAAAPAIKPRRK